MQGDQGINLNQRDYFDARQYSFFADFGEGPTGGIGDDGGLEDGVHAPPEEHLDEGIDADGLTGDGHAVIHQLSLNDSGPTSANVASSNLESTWQRSGYTSDRLQQMAGRPVIDDNRSDDLRGNESHASSLTLHDVIAELPDKLFDFEAERETAAHGNPGGLIAGASQTPQDYQAHRPSGAAEWETQEQALHQGRLQGQHQQQSPAQVLLQLLQHGSGQQSPPWAQVQGWNVQSSCTAQGLGQQQHIAAAVNTSVAANQLGLASIGNGLAGASRMAYNKPLEGQQALGTVQSAYPPTAQQREAGRSSQNGVQVKWVGEQPSVWNLGGRSQAAVALQQQGHRTHPMGGRRAQPPGAANQSLMTADEVEHVMRCSQTLNQPKVPYYDDYYYQAVVNKALGINGASFHPDTTAPQAVSGVANGTKPAFVGLEGLGKVPLANIRTPKHLIDLGAANEDVTGQLHRLVEGKQIGQERMRLLAQEPLLAAKMVLEECSKLIIQIDDFDREISCRGFFLAPNDISNLLFKRGQLVERIGKHMAVPEVPVLGPGLLGGGADTVFCKLMSLASGRDVLSKALRRLFLPHQCKKMAEHHPHCRSMLRSYRPPLYLLWALLRNCRLFFTVDTAETVDDQLFNMCTYTVEVAAAAAELFNEMPHDQRLVPCLEALVGGDFCSQKAEPTAAGVFGIVLPFHLPDVVYQRATAWLPAPSARPMWLDTVLAGLLHAGNILPVSPEDMGAMDRWRQAYAQLFAAVVLSLRQLGATYSNACEQGTEDVAEAVRQLLPADLLRALFLMATPDQQRVVKEVIAQIGRPQVRRTSTLHYGH